jgi:hypothetical protein
MGREAACGEETHIRPKDEKRRDRSSLFRSGISLAAHSSLGIEGQTAGWM